MIQSKETCIILNSSTVGKEIIFVTGDSAILGKFVIHSTRYHIASQS